MGELVGFSDAAVDVKGRLAIPFRFRRLMIPGDDETLMLSPGFEGGIMAFPKSVWAALRSSIGPVNPFSKEQRKLLRWFGHSNDPCPIDAQGRIMIPGHLRQRAKIESRVIVGGSFDWLEIWNPDEYERVVRSEEPEISDIADGIRFKPITGNPEM